MSGDGVDGCRLLAPLAAQEELLVWPRAFTSADALELGCAVAGLAPEYPRGFSVSIVREADGLTTFEWAADDKAPRNQGFMAAKRKAVVDCGRSSLRVWAEHELLGLWGELFSAMEADVAAGRVPAALPVAGAFPIRERDGAGPARRVATLAVSGLHDGQDHEVMVRGLCAALGLAYGTDVPAYAGPAE